MRTLIPSGVASPIIRGVSTFGLNHAIDIGPAIMMAVLIAIGFVAFTGLTILLLAGVYLAINVIEAQLITPAVAGRVMTFNPFVIFLSIAFSIW